VQQQHTEGVVGSINGFVGNLLLSSSERILKIRQEFTNLSP